MKIALIGAGRLATNLGRALFEAGHDVVQVYSRTLKSASELALTIDAEPIDKLESVTDEAQIYIISVKDDVIADLATRLCIGREKAIFIHTAGSISIDIFNNKAQHYGVLYPMQTFSKSREVDFKVIPCFIEGNDDYATKTLHELASSISDRVYELSSDDRRYLHLAAVWACNFTNHCYEVSAEILEHHGIPFDVMLPLIDETAAKVHSMAPADAQTGPAIRFDENVIRAQAALMRDNPLQKDIYERLSMSIHQVALRKG